MSEERLPKVLLQYITDTVTYMATVTDFYEIFFEWRDCREKEYEKMTSIKERADEIDPTFVKSQSKWKAVHKHIKSQKTAESKLAELEKELTEVLKETLEGLEKLNTFLDAMEKLAVTSQQVFTENQILYLPEKFDFDDVHTLISTARQICPLLLKFKRDAKSFFLPKLHNLEVLTYQLQNYVDTATKICEIHGKSFNFEICLEMVEEIVVDTDDLCENDMQNMIDHIQQLDKIRMDGHFQVEFLFETLSSAGFINKCDAHLPTMLKCLDELEQCIIQLDKMNKGAKISRVAGGSVRAVGGILSIAGLVLMPVTAGVSLGLTFAGMSMEMTSEINSLVTTLTETGVNHTHQKKANEVYENFMEDFQKIQECFDEVIKEPSNSLKPTKIDVAMGVMNCLPQVNAIKKGIDAICTVADTTKKMVAGNSEAVQQEGEALCDASSLASDVPDIGQETLKGSLTVIEGLSGFASEAYSTGKEIFSVVKDRMSLTKGSEAKVSKFLKARVALFLSQIESWEMIRNSLCESQLTSEENRNILKQPFYLGDREDL